MRKCVAVQTVSVVVAVVCAGVTACVVYTWLLLLSCSWVIKQWTSLGNHQSLTQTRYQRKLFKDTISLKATTKILCWHSFVCFIEWPADVNQILILIAFSDVVEGSFLDSVSPFNNYLDICNKIQQYFMLRQMLQHPEAHLSDDQQEAGEVLHSSAN